MRAVFFFAAIAICCARLPAQVSFSVMPALNVPAGKNHFNPGFGGSVSLDWAFFPKDAKWKLGVGLTGNMAGFPVDHSGSFSVMGAGLGPFARWRLNDRFSFQANANAGIYRYNWEDLNNVKFFAGGAVAVGFHVTPFLSLVTEAGYTWHSFSDRQPINNFKAGLGAQLNLSELVRPQTRVSIEITEQNRVFPVIFAWYEKNSIATLRITNGEPNAITGIQLSFLLERYMNRPYTFATVSRLGPGESLELPVTALFNESILDLTEPVTAAARIIAGYRSLGVRKTAGFQMQIPVYNRNTITWDDDRRAASFVSPGDPAAVYFSRYVLSAVGNAANGNIPVNVRLAAALFETLRLYGINYIIDPVSSYTELSENALATDSLNYPYETLIYRGGDCDDLSVLFASMLEALNIESAFITIPGHIYIAFNIDDENWRAGNGGVIEFDGKRWLPVEVTVPAVGFTEACRIGALQWRRAGETARLLPMRGNLQEYPSVSAISAGDNLPSMPGRDSVVRALEAELQKLP